MPGRRLLAALILLGLAEAACLAGITASGDLSAVPSRFVFLFMAALGAMGLATWLTFRRPVPDRWVLPVILGGAVLFRLILLPSPPSLSTDLYRYLWDGRVQQAGLSPYQFPPEAPELASLRDRSIYPAINHPDWVTIYPPGAQVLFRAMAWIAPGRVLAMKGLFVLLDLASTGLIVLLLIRLKMDPTRVILYAWHPLVLVEIAGSGHLDAVVVPLMVGALLLALGGRPVWAGWLLGLGGSIKLYPLLLLPAVTGPRAWRPFLPAAVVVGAGYLVFLPGPGSPLGSLGRYLSEEWFNPGIRVWVEWGLHALGVDPGNLVRWGSVAIVGLVGIGVWVTRVSLSPVERAFIVLGAYLLLIPNLFPWYLVPMIPLLCIRPTWPWLWLSGAAALSYLFFTQTPWSVPVWVLAVEFVPLWAGLILTWVARPRPLSFSLALAHRKEV